MQMTDGAPEGRMSCTVIATGHDLGHASRGTSTADVEIEHVPADGTWHRVYSVPWLQRPLNQGVYYR